MSQPAVFLDRDGTICVLEPYLHEPAKTRLIQGAPEAIRTLFENGFLIIVITNQSGIARGLFQKKDMEAVNERIVQLLAEGRARLDGMYHCPHHPDEGCKCRKPMPGLIEMAAIDMNVDLKASYFIGDNISDIEAGHAAGCLTILVRTGYGEKELARKAEWKVAPTHVAKDLKDAVDWIISIKNKEQGKGGSGR